MLLIMYLLHHLSTNLMMALASGAPLRENKGFCGDMFGDVKQATGRHNAMPRNIIMVCVLKYDDALVYQEMHE
jgi:hypothetical protein